MRCSPARRRAGRSWGRPPRGRGSGTSRRLRWRTSCSVDSSCAYLTRSPCTGKGSRSVRRSRSVAVQVVPPLASPHENSTGHRPRAGVGGDRHARASRPRIGPPRRGGRVRARMRGGRPPLSGTGPSGLRCAPHVRAQPAPRAERRAGRRLSGRRDVRGRGARDVGPGRPTHGGGQDVDFHRPTPLGERIGADRVVDRIEWKGRGDARFLLITVVKTYRAAAVGALATVTERFIVR